MPAVSILTGKNVLFEGCERRRGRFLSRRAVGCKPVSRATNFDLGFNMIVLLDDDAREVAQER
jgi:hypothetical protein